MKKTNEEIKKSRQITTRKYTLKKMYNMSLEEYDIILKKQNNKCAICESLTPKRKGINYFIVDHCHKTGRTRGLLCDKCNKLLGAINDDIGRLKSIVIYLDENKALD